MHKNLSEFVHTKLIFKYLEIIEEYTPNGYNRIKISQLLLFSHNEPVYKNPTNLTFFNIIM